MGRTAIKRAQPRLRTAHTHFIGSSKVQRQGSPDLKRLMLLRLVRAAYCPCCTAAWDVAEKTGRLSSGAAV